MKIFDYKNAPKALLTPDIVAVLTSIHEHPRPNIILQLHRQLYSLGNIH